jgi:hypothetical protein
MQSKYRSEGLVCISVSCDEADSGAPALAFLQRMNAKLENYHWVDTADALDEHLGSYIPPSIMVYGRDGKLVKLFKNAAPDDHVEAEKLVHKLLK